MQQAFLPNEIQPVPDHMAKGQLVRLADVFIIGPTMMYFAMRARREPVWLRSVMFAFGAGTVLYNGRNFLAVRKYVQMCQSGELTCPEMD